MAFNIPFKYRVQIVRNEKENKLIKNRTCFMIKGDTEKYFNRTKASVVPGEILFLEERKKATDPFQEVGRYEISEEKRVLEA